MTKNLTKLAAHLQSFEQKRKAEAIQNQHKDATAVLVAKADISEAAGFQGGREMKIRKGMFVELLAKFGPELIEWVEPYFYRSEVTIEQYSDYSAPRDADGNPPLIDRPTLNYGWRGGEFQFIGRAKSFHPNYRLVAESTHTSQWRSHNNGKVRIYTGDFGAQNQYKQLKDGTHRYADIATDFYRQWETVVAASKLARAKMSQHSFVQDVLSQVGELKSYGSVAVSASGNADLPIAIRIGRYDSSTASHTTVEKAVVLINALKDAGFCK